MQNCFPVRKIYLEIEDSAVNNVNKTTTLESMG